VTTTALGIRLRSGRAVAVLVAGSSTSIEVRLRVTLALSDPDDPATRQPYHSGFGRLEESEAVLDGRIAVVRGAAQASIRELLCECRAIDPALVRAGLVVGSVTEPDTIGNPHVRAHALEGRLFRDVVEQALGVDGVTSQVVVERNAFATAASLLKRPEAELKRAVSGLGRGIHRPWAADEKVAAMAGWIAVASGTRSPLSSSTS
jgi:hypothetical protein